MHATDRRRAMKSATFWTVPGLAAFIGVVYLLAGWASDNLDFGVFGLALMLAVAVALVLASARSETVEGLLTRRDERINTIDLRATAFAGGAVIAAVLVAFVVEIGRGESGSPYSWLAAIGGTAYIAAVIVLRLRS